MGQLAGMWYSESLSPSGKQGYSIYFYPNERKCIKYEHTYRNDFVQYSGVYSIKGNTLTAGSYSFKVYYSKDYNELYLGESKYIRENTWPPIKN